MKHLLTLLCLTLATPLPAQLRAQIAAPTGAVPAQTIAANSRDLARLFNDIWQDKLKHSPEYATYLGLAGGTAIKYVDPNAFKIPTDISGVTGQTTHQYLIGNAPRTRDYNIQAPGSQNLNASLHRSFPIHDQMALMLEADCLNVWNKVQFSAPGSGWSATASATSSTYGEVTNISNSPRDWQFAAHFNF